MLYNTFCYQKCAKYIIALTKDKCTIYQDKSKKCTEKLLQFTKSLSEHRSDYTVPLIIDLLILVMYVYESNSQVYYLFLFRQSLAYIHYYHET